MVTTVKAPWATLDSWLTRIPTTAPKAAWEGPLTPRSGEDQAEFATLMAKAGIHPHRGGQELVRCAWHDDRIASLSINWPGCVFNCQASSCTAQGGFKELRALVGVPTPKRTMPSRRSTVGSKPPSSRVTHPNGTASRVAVNGRRPGRDDVQRYQRRLAEALDHCAITDLPRCREGTEWPEAVRECHEKYRVGKCTSCGRHPAFALSCTFPLCTRCKPARFAVDWKEHGEWPERMTLLRLTPTGAAEERKAVQGRFGEWRKRAKLPGGVYGLHALIQNGVISWGVLLAVPEGVTAAVGRAFSVQVVVKGQSPDEIMQSFQRAYLEEAQSWKTPAELVMLVGAIKGRRKFHPFGTAHAHAKKEPAETSAEKASGKKGGRRQALA